MAGRDDLDIWTQLVDARYLKEGSTSLEQAKCLTCSSIRCNNYYCLRCKVGGLCPSAFKDNNGHEAHTWIQVKRQTKHNAVAAKDLERFIDIDGVNHIYKSVQNEEKKCYLKCRIPDASRFIEKRAAAITEKLMKCETCKYAIPKSKTSQMDFLVCSVQCLIGVAENRPQLNLLRLKNGAMDRMQRPQTVNEKLSKGTSASTSLVAVPGVQRVEPIRSNVVPLATQAPPMPGLLYTDDPLVNPELNPSESERDASQAIVLLQKPLILDKKRSGKLVPPSYSKKMRGN